MAVLPSVVMSPRSGLDFWETLPSPLSERNIAVRRYTSLSFPTLRAGRRRDRSWAIADHAINFEENHTRSPEKGVIRSRDQSFPRPDATPGSIYHTANGNPKILLKRDFRPLFSSWDLDCHSIYYIFRYHKFFSLEARVTEIPLRSK